MQVLKAHPALWSGILQPEDVGAGKESFKDADADRWGLGRGWMEGRKQKQLVRQDRG